MILSSFRNIVFHNIGTLQKSHAITRMPRSKTVFLMEHMSSVPSSKTIDSRRLSSLASSAKLDISIDADNARANEFVMVSRILFIFFH